ncbi:MAG: tetratricopeptide repeat protein [Armatimonadota bacterium]|nr:tetratricopeptide repeat protein [Armatimonadota bacterium]
MTTRTTSPASRRTWPLWTILSALTLVAVVVCAFLAWRQSDRSGPAHARQGQAALAAGHIAQAEQEWRQGIRVAPGDPQCYTLLGDLFLRQQRFPEAVAVYTVAAKLSPQDGTLFLRLNRADLAVNDIPAARAAAKRAAELRPDDPDAVGLYGMLENKNNNLPAALTALRRAHELRPDDADYLHALVRLEMNMQNMADAERDLTPWLNAHPDDAWGCHLMAAIFEQKPHTPDTLKAALDYELRAQAGRPNDLHVTGALGELYLFLNRTPDALRVYQSGLRQDPHSEEMLHGLLRCYGRLGQAGQAAQVSATLQQESARHQRMTHLKDVTSLNPADIPSGVELARLQEQEGDDAEAYRLYVRLVTHSPSDPRPRRALADFYRRHDRPGLAQQVLRPDFTPPDAQ